MLKVLIVLNTLYNNIYKTNYFKGKKNYNIIFKIEKFI